MCSPFKIALIAIGFATISNVSSAQTNFIKESQVTEDAMVNALKPPPAEVEAEMKTRSIRISPAPAASGGVKPTTPKPTGGSAPVLLTFETNSTALTATAMKALDVIAKSLGRTELANLSFAIEGHADPRGKPTDNLRLSELRASSVKAYLVNQHSIPENRLRPVGKGASELATPNAPSAPENRRVTFVTLQ
jgi:OmpA-OmpF porin, OOP family